MRQLLSNELTYVSGGADATAPSAAASAASAASSAASSASASTAPNPSTGCKIIGPLATVLGWGGIKIAGTVCEAGVKNIEKGQKRNEDAERSATGGTAMGGDFYVPEYGWYDDSGQFSSPYSYYAV